MQSYDGHNKVHQVKWPHTRVDANEEEGEPHHGEEEVSECYQVYAHVEGVAEAEGGDQG